MRASLLRPYGIQSAHREGGKFMREERRKSENAALRELIDALRDFIAARDALWSLSFFDRLFRFEKCRGVISAYDHASVQVRNSIRAVMEASKDSSGNREKVETSTPSLSGLLSVDEFDLLLGRPRQAKLSKPGLRK